MIDGLNTLSSEAKQFYDKTLLYRAVPNLALTKFGQARNIPRNSGNQVSYRRFNQIATSTVALTEAITPAPSSLNMTEITGTVQQYGNYVLISDQINLMGIDPVMTQAADVLGENAGQSVEEIIRAELLNGTSVLFPPSRTARNQITSSDLLTLTLVRKGIRNLMNNDTLPFQGDRGENGMNGMFMGYIHPFVFYDLFGDTTVLNTFSYSDPDMLYKFQMPIMGGVVWIISTKAPKFAGAGSGSADVYGTFLFGKNAFGVVNVGGSGKFQTIAKPLGSSGTEDALDQRASQGWKAFQLPKILNNNFFLRIETSASA